MKQVMGLLAALMLGACASTGEPDAAAPRVASAPAAASELVCEYTARTGTTIPSKRCFTAEQRDASRQAVKDLQDTLPGNAPSDASSRK
jgi:hypothetical protein